MPRFGGLGKNFGKMGITGGNASILPVSMRSNPPDIFLNFMTNKSRLNSNGAISTAAALLTVSRAGTATLNDGSGTWTSVSANLPRISNLGLLVEESRVNSIRNNTMVGTVAGTPGTNPNNWATSGFSGLTIQIVSQFAASGIDFIRYRFSGTTSGTFGALFPNGSASGVISASAAQSWGNSIFLALSAGSWTNVTTFKNYMRCWDITPTQLADQSGQSLLGVGSTITRFSDILTTPATTVSIEPFLQWNWSSGVAVDFTIDIGWPQIEVGASVTSPILTTSATVTRNADGVTLTTPPSFGSSYSSFAQGTPQVPTTYGSNQYHVGISDGSSANRLALFRQAGAGAASEVMSSGGVGQFSTNSTVINQNVSGKWAVAATAGDQAFSVNGGAPTTGTGASMPVGPNRVDIGQFVGGGAAYFNGFLEQGAIWSSQRISNSTLTAITL